MKPYRKNNKKRIKLHMKFLTLAVLLVIVLNSCTLSFSNVSTHGTASDVVDSEPDTDADLSPTIEIPLKA
jgi:hypothetical protein